MNKSMIGALILTMTLLPSIASAATTRYEVDAGMVVPYQVDGVSSVEPTLDQDVGSAEILNPVFALGKWSFSIRCNSLVDCEGDILH